MIVPVVAGGLGGLALVFWARKSKASEARVLGLALYVAALIYVGFAIAGEAPLKWVGIEVAGLAIYGFMAARGSKGSMPWIAAGWGLHALWGAGVHGESTPFVPGWYIVACVAFDFLVAGYALGRAVQPEEVVEVVDVSEWREARDAAAE